MRCEWGKENRREFHVDKCKVPCLGNKVHRHDGKQRLSPILQKVSPGLEGIRSRAQVSGDDPLPQRQTDGLKR